MIRSGAAVPSYQSSGENNGAILAQLKPPGVTQTISSKRIVEERPIAI
jgi:hypothetical protein